MKVAAQNEVVVKETAMVGHESTAATHEPVPRALPESTNKLQTPPALSFPIQLESFATPLCSREFANKLQTFPTPPFLM